LASFTFRPRVFPLELAASAEGLASALSSLGSHRAPVLLDSAAGSPSEFSLLAFDPLQGAPPPTSLAELRAYWGQLAAVPGDEVPGPFAGGFLGALAYDLGVTGERLELPAEPWGFAPIAGGLYVDFIVQLAAEGTAWLVLGEDPGDGRPGVEARRARLLAELAREPAANGARIVGALERCTPPDEHMRRIESVRAAIAAGEIYQANLAHRLLGRVVGPPADLYRLLRRANPAPYCAYLEWGGPAGGGAVLSTSPELLLEFDGERARTRPIKGTAPRDADPARDREQRDALLGSDKDLAELAMIVDLERNDLGRVARPGSVRVEGLPTCESYARVHHLVADVSARIRPELDAFDVLAALFPGGSITGAPKLRSMEVIAELEGEGRGFFTGSLGFVDTRGRALFNILIRTVLWRPRPEGSSGPEGDSRAGEVSLRVGGGITWRSRAEAEDQETLDKAAALASVLDPTGDERPR